MRGLTVSVVQAGSVGGDTGATVAKTVALIGQC